MLATDKQIKYLCALADKVEKIKAINKSAKKRHQPQRLWLSISVFRYAWIFHRTICGWILQQTSR